MTPEQEDRVRQKIVLIRRKVGHIFDLLDEIERELESGRTIRRYNSSESSDHSNTVDTSIPGKEEKEEKGMGAENSTSGYYS